MMAEAPLDKVASKNMLKLVKMARVYIRRLFVRPLSYFYYPCVFTVLPLHNGVKISCKMYDHVDKTVLHFEGSSTFTINAMSGIDNNTWTRMSGK